MRLKSVSRQLKGHLHEPDQETQEVSESDTSGHNMNIGVLGSQASGGVSTQRGKSREVRRTLPKSKLDFLRLEITTYKELLQSISVLFSQRPIFLVLDDFYFVPKSIQPGLIDYFHRLTKGTDLFLKIATIKHRSKLYRKDEEQYTGAELGHDIYEIDMDYTLDKFDELQAFMRQILVRAIDESGATLRLDDVFAGEGFAQLCLASGGVPRDFLSLFVTLANRSGASGQGIGKVQVTEAAINTIRSKKESMKQDSGDDDAVLDEYLSRIKRYVYDDKRTNAFLVAKDDLENDPQVRQAIRELVDLRLIHLVDQNTSRAPSDGRRYEAFILDVGLYENPRPRKFNQVEPGQRDEKARKDELRASPVIDFTAIRELVDTVATVDADDQPPSAKPSQLELTFE
ncbi:hypothetical protein SH528x_004702 [Novipirellula sp. SH528]|uniref:hypothetical protein n=1 Tax=Novipirellula sp. SH528 TaxID=3454466 RepID=UPI003FA166F5